MYISYPDGSVTWFGPMRLEVKFWRDKFVKLQDDLCDKDIQKELVKVKAQYQELKEKYEQLLQRHAPFLKFETKEWKQYVKQTEEIYASRTKGPRQP
jgi:hypothetical protein